MGIVHRPGVSGLYASWATIPCKRPPPISQHLYAKHQTFPTQSPTIGTWGKQPPLISCRNHFLAWQLYSFPLILNTCNSLWASSPGHSGSGAGKGRRPCNSVHLWNLNICIEKVDAKCWLAKMTLVMTSLHLARVFQRLFTFAPVSASRWLVEIWQLSWRAATGELEVEFKFPRHSCKLSFLFAPLRQSAPES